MPVPFPHSEGIDEPSVYHLLDGNMEEAARKYGWPLIVGSEFPEDLDIEALRRHRTEKVRDIISAFHEMEMPDDFRKDLVGTITEHRTPEQCIVQRDFEATMFRLAVIDGNVFDSLQRVMPSGARAAIFFDKIQRNSHMLLGRFDQTEDFDELQTIVGAVYQHIEKIRDSISSRAPHGEKGAAQALVSLLDEMSDRDCDYFAGNLSATLSILEGIPHQTLAQWGQKLKRISEKLEDDEDVPGPFKSKLKSLIPSEFSGPSFSGHKRPAAGLSGSGRKKTR